MPMADLQETPRSFFMDNDGRHHYCRICLDCDRSCKQSFRIIGIYCPYYEKLKKERKDERKKVVI